MSDYKDKNKNSSLQKTPSGNVEGSKKGDKIPAQELLPTGVLAIHIKRCKNLKIMDAGAKAFSKRLPVCLYMKIMVGDVIKMTSINDVRCGNNVGAVFDDLKHFLITVNNKLDDESNKIRFILMGFQGNNKHRKLGEKEINLLSIIRNLFIVETLEFAKNAHSIGEVDMEMAFSYGCFGYGYSSQLESKSHTPTEQISQSLFYRAEAPNDRKHDTKDIMTAIPVPHPPFVNWPVEVDIVMGGREYMTESITDIFSGKEKGKREYPLLMAAMNTRMTELQKRYASFTKRSQRLSFLQSLVTAKINPDLEENQDDMLFSKDTGAKHRSAESLDHNQANQDYGQYEYDNPGILTRIVNYFGYGKEKKEELVKVTTPSLVLHPQSNQDTREPQKPSQDSAAIAALATETNTEDKESGIKEKIPMITLHTT